jgi:two-component system phosphate regulon sensor histidine kinase PhoR
MLDNALKYGKGSAQVEVTLSPDDGDPVRPDGAHAFVLRVVDQGPGIEADEQSRIFDRFVRGRVAYDQRVRGSGIGLSLVKRIAESHGGSVRVQSPPAGQDRGCAFELRLPAVPPGHAG